MFLGKNAAGKNKYEIYLNNLTPLFKDGETIKSPHFKEHAIASRKIIKTFSGASRTYSFFYLCWFCT